MAKLSKPKLLTNNGKTPTTKLGGVSASKQPSPLLQKKRNHKKAQVPDEAFAMPGFGQTGLTGRS